MPDQTLPELAVNVPLAALRGRLVAETPLTEAPLVPGLGFRLDPAAGMTGRWQSPRGRLLELETDVTTPGGWLGLHLALPLADLAGVAWIGFAARTAAGQALALRACLRSGLEGGGFRDIFFDRHLLSQPAESDHVDMLAPSRQPDLPMRAPWREFILFLPPDRSIAWALHDLRLFVL